MSDAPGDGRERWALILGSSSGFGAATAVALAAEGHPIIGVHLDLRNTIAEAEAIRRQIADLGVEVRFHNINAADEAKRQAVVADIGELFAGRRAAGADPFVAVFLHSLAFGTTLSYITTQPGRKEVSQRQLEMTADVMAHSMVYWTRDLFHAGLLGQGTRIFAMTSEGAAKVVPTYGPVSAAKAALESHVRQLALELGTEGVAVNAIRAGVTDTPAVRKIPIAETLLGEARRRNPGGRLTEPDDVAQAIVALSLPGTRWISGNVIGVDGAEDVTA